MPEEVEVKERIVYVERKRRGCMMPLLAILVLAIVGGGIYAATNPTKGGSGGTTAKLGQAVLVGSWKVTVEKTELAPELTWSTFGNKETAKGQFLKVYVNAENVTDKTDSPKSFDYKVRDDKGAEYTHCGELGCFVAADHEKLTALNNDIPPRTSAKVLAVFDVAKDAKGFTLEIEGGKAKITLDK